MEVVLGSVDLCCALVQQTLHFTYNQLHVSLSENQRNELLAKYLQLPAFTVAVGSLSALAEDYSLIAFSNGEQQAVNSLLTHAGIYQSV